LTLLCLLLATVVAKAGGFRCRQVADVPDREGDGDPCSRRSSRGLPDVRRDEMLVVVTADQTITFGVARQDVRRRELGRSATGTSGLLLHSLGNCELTLTRLLPEGARS